MTNAIILMSLLAAIAATAGFTAFLMLEHNGTLGRKERAFVLTLALIAATLWLLALAVFIAMVLA